MADRSARLTLLPFLALAALGMTQCYSTGDGTPPPLNTFYFPVGLQVSAGGNVLYVVNSDFDLQYNGGTIQSYDLQLVREHAISLIADPNSPDPAIPISRAAGGGLDACPGNPPVYKDNGSGSRQPLGETCSPPVDSTYYFRDAGIIGAFATDLLLSPPPALLQPLDGALGSRHLDRLFTPVRGNASLTWATVLRDTPNDRTPRTTIGGPAIDPTTYPAFLIDCEQGSDHRCGDSHLAGVNPLEPGNTRYITMPGEPFGIAMTEDGASVVITHQSDTEVSLFSTGLSRDQDDNSPVPPALEFILNTVPTGGVGVTPVPHDPAAYLDNPALAPLPAFLWTNRNVAEIDLLRRYNDEVGNAQDATNGSSLRRPFLDREAVFPITPAAGGTDSRGVIVDPTPRIACKAQVAPADTAAGRTQDVVNAELEACAQKPARVFIANRTPASLIIGEIGGKGTDEGPYDADRLTLSTSIPLAAGPSKLYLAPVVDTDGSYALRLFIVCFDSAQIYVYDPEAQQVENILRVAPGPFAMAFDPFDMTDVATHAQAPIDPRENFRYYRFGYLASFTDSYIQLLDLDNSLASHDTFERVVFTLGAVTLPKGS